MRLTTLRFLSVLTAVLFFTQAEVSGQTAEQRLTDLIIAKDATFWAAYNKCDTDAFRTMFTDDVEFYHDKGGPTIGFENFMDALKNGLCGNTDSRLRRAELKETVKVFPLAKNGEYYGAIISGEHVFYVNQKGKPEFLDGHARFMQLWLLRNGEWKMARILSYDHGDAKQRLKRSPNQRR